RAWPDHWQAILSANNRHPPLSLRVNPHRATRGDYLERLHAQGMEARPIPHTDQGISLVRPVDALSLPGFADGACSVQDGAAQLAAPLLDARPGERVLDACCAPGGKTTHLLECQPRARVVALDKDPRRLETVRANLERLQLHAETIAADAADPHRWWDGQPFDRILLDTPCSATGVIRRHPDIKVLRRAADITALAATQQRLLDALWPLLRRGGMLLYTTCSVLKEENQDRIRAFIDTHPEARLETLRVVWGHALDQGRQVLPGDDDMDGFYYARLRKQRG
ncbi:MAG TPA: 16S rRNA (cytosine(967)-C(5))-methyltransferase RsmB, partial [Gammaproteobacteria bacterium]|nr:16S rRNA (cytosine(967)-C(5))-methyltransferase RsmB [Gammaproteobacteria bacterium]